MRLLFTFSLLFLARLLSAQCNPPVSINPVPRLCNGDPTYQLSATPTGGVWSGPQISPGGLIALSGLKGVYQATYIFSDSTCTDTVQAGFQVIGGPSLSAGTDFSIVCGGTPRVNGAYIPGPNRYAFWSTPDGNLLDPPTDLNGRVSEPGTYILTAIDTTVGCPSRDTSVCYPYLPSFPHTLIVDTICQGDTLLGYTTSGNFYTKYETGAPCDSFRVVRLTVLKPLRDTLTAVICAGDNIDGYTQSGIYIDTLSAFSGCDSIRTLALTVRSVPGTQVQQTICAGQSFEGYTQSGIYTDTYTAANGCDSVRTLALTVLPVFETQIQLSTCDPAQAGVLISVFQAANGCDSTVTITVTLLPGAASQVQQTICAGQSFEGYTQSGVYTDTFQAANGCDSVRTLALTVLPVLETDLQFSTCDPSQAGVFSVVLQAVNGCDSTVTTTVTLLPGATSQIEQTICAGQSFEGYTQSGVYTDTYSAANGCDSVRTLALTVLPVLETDLQFSTCDPSQAGVFSVVLQAVNGCDSTVTITVTLLPGAASQIQQTICAGQSFEGYTQSGVYTDTYTAANGCDSIRTLQLTVQQLPAASADIEPDHGSADGAIDLVSLGGVQPFQLAWSTGDSTTSLTGLAAGDYILTLTDATGCSAVLTFTVPLMVGASDPGEPTLHLSAAPNPQQAGQPVLIRLNTSGSGQCQVAVYTATGRLLRRFNREDNGDETIFPLEFPIAGVYMVQVADGKGRSGVLRVVVW